MLVVNALKGLLKVSAKDDIRYYLNGIHITCDHKGLVTMESSDGYIGLILTLTNNTFGIAENTDVILCGKSVSKLIKLFGSKEKPELIVNNKSASIGGYDIDFIEGRYPDLSRAMRLSDKGDNECKTIGLQFSLMKRVCEACELCLGSKKVRNGEFIIRDQHTSLLIKSSIDESDFLQAAIMPTRLQPIEE